MGLASGRRPQPVLVGVYVDDICVAEGDTIMVLDIHFANLSLSLLVDPAGACVEADPS